MTTLADLEASVRLAHIAAAQTCLAAAVVSLGNAQRAMENAATAGQRSPMYDLSDGQMRFHAREIALLVADVELRAARLAPLEARQ